MQVIMLRKDLMIFVIKYLGLHISFLLVKNKNEKGKIFKVISII